MMKSIKLAETVESVGDDNPLPFTTSTPTQISLILCPNCLLLAPLHHWTRLAHQVSSLLLYCSHAPLSCIFSFSPPNFCRCCCSTHISSSAHAIFLFSGFYWGPHPTRTGIVQSPKLPPLRGRDGELMWLL
jgi:hypothetical protein